MRLYAIILPLILHNAICSAIWKQTTFSGFIVNSNDGNLTVIEPNGNFININIIKIKTGILSILPEIPITGLNKIYGLVLLNTNEFFVLARINEFINTQSIFGIILDKSKNLKSIVKYAELDHLFFPKDNFILTENNTLILYGILKLNEIEKNECLCEITIDGNVLWSKINKLVSDENYFLQKKSTKHLFGIFPTGLSSYLYEYDERGNEIFNKHFYANNFQYISESKYGGFILAGNIMKNSTLIGYFAKLDENLNISWSYSQNKDLYYSFIYEANDQNYYLFGATPSNDHFYPTNGIINTIDSNNNIKWRMRINEFASINAAIIISETELVFYKIIDKIAPYKITLPSFISERKCYELNECKNCAYGLYWNYTDCIKCKSGCGECVSENLCLSCSRNYKMKNYTCYENTYIPIETNQTENKTNDKNTNTTIKCIAKLCEKCYKNIEHCFKCKENATKNFKNNTQIDKCECKPGYKYTENIDECQISNETLIEDQTTHTNITNKNIEIYYANFGFYITLVIVILLLMAIMLVFIMFIGHKCKDYYAKKDPEKMKLELQSIPNTSIFSDSIKQ